MKTGWLPCSNKSQAWPWGERGLGQLIWKKECLSSRCTPLPGSQLRSLLPEAKISMGWPGARCFRDTAWPKSHPTTTNRRVPLTISSGNWGQWREHRPAQIPGRLITTARQTVTKLKEMAISSSHPRETGLKTVKHAWTTSKKPQWS